MAHEKLNEEGEVEIQAKVVEFGEWVKEKGAMQLLVM